VGGVGGEMESGRLVLECVVRAEGGNLRRSPRPGVNAAKSHQASLVAQLTGTRRNGYTLSSIQMCGMEAIMAE
jgi:hypothetical protein